MEHLLYKKGVGGKRNLCEMGILLKNYSLIFWTHIYVESFL